MKKKILLAILVAIVTLSFGQEESASEITTTVAPAILPPPSISVQANTPEIIAPRRPTIIGAIKNFKINLLYAMADKFHRIHKIF